MNTDPRKSAQSCGCDEGARHLCLECAAMGKGYGCSQLAGRLTPARTTELVEAMGRLDQQPTVIKANGGIGLKWPPVQKGLFPESAEGRKAHPVFTGVLMYFPDAIAAVAHVSKVGNDQHNPGQPLHWAREKSTDQMDTAARHQMDHGVGNIKDTDGTYHLAKAAWRILAELQLTIEKEREGR